MAEKVKIGTLYPYSEIDIDGEKYVTIMSNGNFNYQVLAIPSRLVKVLDLNTEVELWEDKE